MTSRRTSAPALLCAACALFVGFSPTATAAKPQILLFGGGWGPEGNQASLEVQLQDLQSVFPRAPLRFAGGRSGQRMVQEQLSKPDRAGQILGQVFDRPDNLTVQYRTSRLKQAGVLNKTTATEILSRATARRDTIAVWVGHGDLKEEDGPSRLLLWGPDDALTPAELGKHLGASRGRLGLVLGQCHSGGFADVMYLNGDSASQLAEPTRCVLASVPADRVAAGCTPDINDKSARAYVSWWTEGVKQKVDYDGDKKTSLAEALVFAALNDPTIDIPVRSSDLYLAQQMGEHAPNLAAMSRAQLEKGARPEQRALLSLFPRTKPGAMVRRAQRLSDQLEKLQDVYDAAALNHQTARRRVVDKVLGRWPELANPLHVVARRLLGEQAEAIAAWIEELKEFAALQKASDKLGHLEKKLVLVERKEARVLRWLHVAQGIANALQTQNSGPKPWQRAYKSLVACESMTAN